MKRFLQTFLAIIFVFCCFGLVGCGDKYGELKFSLSFSYSQNDKVETLDDGTKRVETVDYIFDEKFGVYTFYVSKDKFEQGNSVLASLKVTYAGVPDDFNYGTTASSSKPEVLSNAVSSKQVDDSVYLDISIVGDGQSELKVINNETGLEKSVYVYVNTVADSLQFSKDQIAFANVVEDGKVNKISLLQYLSNQDKNNLSFKFGELTDGVFTEYDDETLNKNHLVFSKSSCELILEDKTDFSSLDVEATYTFLAGDDTELKAYTTIRFLKDISNFAVYKGQNYSDTKTDDNLIKSLEIYSNLVAYKYVDLVLVANTNGEEVEFEALQDDNFPFEVEEISEIVYLNENEIETLDYTKAKTAYQKIRLIATKTTDNTSIYGEEMKYDLLFNCDYANYVVPNYPIHQQNGSITTKVYELIQFFKINDETMDGYQSFDNALSKDIYLNSSNEVKGEPFVVSVDNSATILSSNAKFYVEFYNKSNKEKYNDITTYLDIYLDNSDSPLNNTELGGAFGKDSVFYVKPKSSMAENDQIYMVFRAEKPNKNQAVAYFLLTVEQGIKEIKSIDYSFYQYKIENGDYVWSDGSRVTEEQFFEGVEFDVDNGVYVAKNVINLDTDVPNISTTVKLNCDPVGASLDNLSIVSSNPNLLSVKKSGADNEFIFTVTDTTKSGGDVVVTITASNLTKVYKINFKIYNAVNNLVVSLSDPNSTANIELENNNVKKAKVEYMKLYNFVTIVQPTSSKYEITYSLYKGSKENLIDSLICEYSGVSYKITSGNSEGILRDDDFLFKASNLSFYFINNTTNEYILEMKIINANGAVIFRDIALSCYVPLSSIKITNLKDSVYNANKIYFENKVISNIVDGMTVLDEESILKDDSVFGIKVSISGKFDKTPTYSFDNYGYIELKIDNETIRYEISNGRLQDGDLEKGNYIKALSYNPIELDSDTYFIFRLQETYTKNVTNKIYVTVGTTAIEGQKLKAMSSSISILPVSQVLGLSSSTTSLNLRQGASATNFDIGLLGDNIKNDNILTKVVGVKKFRDKTYFIESDGEDGLFNLSLLSNSSTITKKYSLQVDASYVGQGYVLLVPQDKVTTSKKYNNFIASYEKISDLKEEEFEEKLFYTLDAKDGYVIATNYIEGGTYYLKVLKQDNLDSFIDDVVEIEFSISDGIDVPYQISTVEELVAIGDSSESVTKNYVLTKDIEIGTKTFAPIGNYYEASIESEDEFESCIENLYVLHEDTYILAGDTFNDKTQYYKYGFNGNLSGKYVITSLDGNETIKYYGLTNIKYNEDSNGTIDGIFATLGSNGMINDLSLSFESYKMKILSANHISGGLVTKNYGMLKNISTSFSGFTLTASGNLTFGGVVGENYGTVDYSTISSSFTLNGAVLIESTIANANLLIGGYVGANYGYIIGSSKVNSNFDIAYDDLGFDCNLILNVNDNSGKGSENSNIGIVAGYSNGSIKNFSANGQIKASSMDNVGGLVGKIEYSKLLVVEGNEEKKYSLQDSYSIVFVDGRNNVGGVVGQTFVTSEFSRTGKVELYSVSAENYATQSYVTRSFVKGVKYVGGLIGCAENTQIYYSYVASYYDLTQNGFDVQGTQYVGGLVGQLNNCTITSSGCYVNVESTSSKNADLFVAIQRDISINKVFAYGYCKGASSKGLQNYNNSYSVMYDVNDGSKCYVNGVLNKTRIENISAGDDWEKINDLLYYPLKDGNSIISTLPSIEVNVIEPTSYERYRNGNSVESNPSVILFLAQDLSETYTNEQLTALNTISIEEFLKIIIKPWTYKTSKISITTKTATDILKIENGKLILQKEGTVTLKIASKLASSSAVEVNVVIMSGVSSVKLYSTASVSLDLSQTDVEMVKNSSQVINAKMLYDRILDEKTLSLNTPKTGVGVRIIVRNEDINDNYSAYIDKLEDLFYFSSPEQLSWNWEQVKSGATPTYQYVDIENASSFTLFARGVEISNVKIHYVPFIKKTIDRTLTTILLEDMEGSFYLTVKTGSTDIILENNVDSNITMSQLEKLAITLTIYTDVTSDEIKYDCYDNYGNIVELNKNGLYEASTIKTFTKLSSTDTTGKISYTYTFWYKNKLETLSSALVYNFEFYASSNEKSKKCITLTILPEKDLKSISARVYSEESSDFPQKPSQNKIIYNGRVALLTLEAFPFLADFSKIKLSYGTTSKKSMSIIQVEYNASQSGVSSKLFSVNLNNGAVYDSEGTVIIKKESAQDIYSENPNGVYSYSRFYFFDLLIPSDTPDRSIFYLYIDVLDSQGKVILTQTVAITSLSKTSIDMSFDERFKGEDELYYLPVNTKQKLDVTITNSYSVATWDVSCDDIVLTSSQKAIFTPYMEDGAYYVDIMNYDNNKFSTDFIGKTFTLTLTLDNGKTSDPVDISFVVSLFSVTNIGVDGVIDGYLTVKNSTTTPLYVYVETEYDESLDEKENWYSVWYNNYITTKEEDNLYKILKNSGYEIKANFADYIVLLQEKITKASYDSSVTNVSTYTSGVWLYKDSQGSLTPLKSGSTYNDRAFGVERYNQYVAVYGYETDIDSNLMLSVRLSYSSISGRETLYGMPNVNDYNYDASIYKSMFKFSQEFILSFKSALDFDNPTPISSAKEFLELSSDEGGNYRLIKDIVLTDYIPFDAKFKSFDGNNYTIYVVNFAGASSLSSSDFGLFTSISKDTMVCNTTVYYTGKVDQDEISKVYSPRAISMTFDISSYDTVNFGGLCVTNNGVITNCKVTGLVNIFTSNSGSSNIMAGLVVNNTSSGYVTNSKVTSFELKASGVIGGFVGKNAGMVVSSMFDASQVVGLNKELNIGGFAYENTGKILECYVQGGRSSTDVGITNTGTFLKSEKGGNIGAFVYKNSATISDCYANIYASTSGLKAGFVYADTSSSIISRCYSIFYRPQGDNASAIFPFVGPYTDELPRNVVVNGVLNNCYYLDSDSGQGWWTENFYSTSTSTDASQTPSNKKAEPLEEHSFMTEDNFVNYNISLEPSSFIENFETYYYVDGYTWAVIGGKPLLVSTLTDTISMQSYIGKKKNYYNNEQVLYNKSDDVTYYEQTENVGLDGNIIRTKYYIQKDNANYTDDDIVFTKTYNKSLNNYTFEYFFENDYSLQVVAEIDTTGVTFKSAQYGDGDKQILDIKIWTTGNEYIDQDDNFRANDTIFIKTDENSEITEIVLKKLQSVSYYYSENVKGYSSVKGTRTNPYILYDYTSLTDILAEDTDGKFYRIVKDIDLEDNYVKTVSKTFKGVLQGNHMTLNNLAISYTNDTTDKDNSQYNTESFGFFAEIATSSRFTSRDTVISNLNFAVKEVISNSHKYVGALAGRFIGGEGSSNKIFINNINIVGDEDTHIVKGKNAVGGLCGYATGNVIIKDINVSVSVDATYDESLSKSDMLYIDSNSTSGISYSGGVVGIFDVDEVIDSSTLKNFNASNITIDTSYIYKGNIVGSAFGLVGKNTIVNYVNVLFNKKDNSFIMTTFYAGGLVGENRGRIISSSVGYKNQEEKLFSISPILTNDDHIFIEISGHTICAIGGLVGLNNGGFISNSITSINVRNENATIAGGAVGRMVGGGLLNVVATGSVLSNSIVGGLVGAINDKDNLINSEDKYNSKAFIDFEDEKEKSLFNARCVSVKGKNLSDGVTTIISSCVAGNNYLSSDYYLLIRLSAFGGFIGLISFYSENSSVSSKCNSAIEYWNKSYYVNTLYSSENSTAISKYINAAYYSAKLDLFVNDLSEINILSDSDDNQMVYPYSIQDFYYEAQNSGVTYSVIQYENTQDGITPRVVSSDHDVVVSIIYEIIQVSHEAIKNADEVYTEIECSSDGNWSTEYDKRSYLWYKARFGRFFYKKKTVDGVVTDDIVRVGDEECDGVYTLVTEDFEETWTSFYTDKGSTGYPKMYYISTPNVTHFDFEKTYTTSGNDIYFAGYNVKRTNGYIFENIEDIKSQKYVIINGLKIPFTIAKSDEEIVTYGEIDVVTSGEYTCYPNLLLPNGCTISKLVFDVKRNVLDNNSVQYVINNVILTYSVADVSVIDSSVSTVTFGDNDLTYLASSKLNNQIDYELKISSKRTIYSRYDNGFWSIDDNFYAEELLSATKYPTNIEIAEVYIWSDFIDEKSVDGYIYTAEQLARVAYDVNNGINSYEGKTLTLANNIDLSGKYWVPIGTKDNPFMGTFDGNGKSIQYLSINQNSTTDSTYLEYAGLFGVIKNAEIKKLSILGGEIVGNVAGGLVGYSIDGTISNIFNRNSAIGGSYAGGIVGKMSGGSLSNCSNDAEVSLYTTTALDVYVGGIVGFVENATLQGDEDNKNINSGKINVALNNTSYVVENKLVNLYAGGIAGKSKNTVISNVKNTGEVVVKTNAHKVYVGGCVGNIDGKTISDAKNNGEISIEYANIFQGSKAALSSIALDEKDVDEYESYKYATLDVGGVVGSTNSNISRLSNLSLVSIKTTTTSSAHISLGGIAGRQKYEDKAISLEESYNSGRISSTSTSSSTFGIGGIVGTIDLNGLSTKITRVVSIKNNYNNGIISSDNICSVFLGGVVGYVYNKGLTLEDCVFIQNNMNIGYATIYDITSSKNALGAIVGYSRYCYTINPEGQYYANDGKALAEGERVSFDMDNYYLAGSAYSGSKVYTDYCTKTNDGYVSKQEVIDDNMFKGKDKDKYFFAKALSSSDLKLKSSYQMRKIKDTDEATYVFDFDNEKIWEFKYGTWYPTLKNNVSTAYWIDNTKEIEKSSSSTYLVSTAEELAYISKIINSGEIDSTNITIKLKKSIDLSNKYFTPIGTIDNPFKGTFDGNLFEIKNLTVDGDSKFIDSVGNDSYDDEFGGLFGVVNGATIMNLGLESPVVQNVSYGAGIVAKATDSLLKYLYTDSSSISLISTSSYISGLFGAGGIVCTLIDSITSSDASEKKGLYNSYNNIYVKAEIETTIRVGAIAGEIDNSGVYNCYNNAYGVITVADNSKYKGIIGKANVGCEIQNVFNLCTKLETHVGTSDTDAKICLYMLVKETGEIKQKTTNFDPVYDNLEGEDKENVWTKEYSLNPAISSSQQYPSLRGLSREWKNSSSEALTSFEYNSNSSNASKELVYNYIDSIKKVYADENTVASGKIDYTLANFSKDSFYGVTVTKVYLVSSEEDLIWIANNVNNGNLITSGVEFMLLKDLDFSGKYFTPIGSGKMNSFKGVFNFNGHVISGLTIDSSYTYAGLFGYTQNALILNGYLTNTFIKINDNSSSATYVGSLVGFAENTNIKNIIVSSCISVNNNGSVYVGGLVGYYSKTNASCGIENVRVYGSKTADIDKYPMIKEGGAIDNESKAINIVGYSLDGGAYVGGVVGYAVASVSSITNLKDLVSYATVKVGIAGISETSATNAYVGVGGIVGYGEKLVYINACEVDSNSVIKSYSNKFDSVGGIAGYINNGRIKNCKSSGYIVPRVTGASGTEQAIWSYIGGIVGSCQEGEISSCYVNASTVTQMENKNNCSIGIIIGRAINKNYTRDSAVYKKDSTGFGLKGFVAAVGEEKDCNKDKAVDEVYKTSDDAPISSNRMNFSENLWKDYDVLYSKKIFVMGAGKLEIQAYLDENKTTTKNIIEEAKQETSAGVEVNDLDSLILQGSEGQWYFAYVAGDINNLSYRYVAVSTNNTSDIEVAKKLYSPADDDYIIAVFIIKTSASAT